MSNVLVRNMDVTENERQLIIRVRKEGTPKNVCIM